MIITVASGKGGTGKTTIATSLALTLMAEESVLEGGKLVLIDCDVEEPNSALFLHPLLTQEAEVALKVPEVDADLCTYCGRCAEVCQYHAIAVVGRKTLVFSELCHGCGSCTLVCPENAIHEVLNVVGRVEKGRVGSMAFVHGILEIGVPMATPVIRAAKGMGIVEPDAQVVIIDAPPGNACPVVQSLRGADYCLMVTEPTPFGLHDLRVAVELARDELHLPVGVVINRDGVGDDGVERFCADEKIPILMRIPLDRRIAEACSQGQPLVSAMPEYANGFLSLFSRICEEASR